MSGYVYEYFLKHDKNYRNFNNVLSRYYYLQNVHKTKMILNLKQSNRQPMKLDNPLTYLLSQRPDAKMSDEQLEQLAPWSETAKANCQN